MHKRETYITLILVWLFSLSSYGQMVIRAKKYGGNSTDFFVYSKTDRAGFIYAYGYYEGTLNIDSSGVNKTYSGFGGRDIFFGKFDCELNPVWINRVGSNAAEGGEYNFGAITFDNNNNVYVTGTCNTNSTFTSANGSNYLFPGMGGSDGFLAKYNTAGERQWVVGIGGNGNDESHSLIFDSDGFLYVVGGFRGIVTFGTTSGATATRTSVGGIDAFLVKYSPNGVLQSSPVYTFGGAASELLFSIDSDKNGFLYLVGGTCCSNTTFSIGTTTISNTASWGSIFLKASRNMDVVWVNQMGGTFSENIAKLLLADSGYFYLYGHYTGTVNLPSRPPGIGMPMNAIGAHDFFVAKYDTSGSRIISKTYGSTGDDFSSVDGLIVNNRNEPIITGQFSGTINLDGKSLVSFGSTSSYVVNLTSSLTANRVLRLGGTATDAGKSLAFGKNGELYALGWHTSPGNFGSLAIGSHGGADAYIAQIGHLDDTKPPLPVSLSCTDATLRIPDPLNGANYQWLRNNIAIPGATDTILQTNQIGQYRYIITGVCNLTDTSMPYFLNSFISVPSIRKDTTVCSGATITLNGRFDSAATNFVWLPSSGLSNSISLTPTATITNSTLYQFVRFYQNGCISRDTFNIVVIPHTASAGIDKFICKGDSVLLSSNSNGLYYWNTLSKLSDSTVINPLAFPDTSTIFVLNSILGNCLIQDSVLVTVIEKPIANAGTDTAICLGQSIILSGNSSSTTFYWNTTVGLSDSLILMPVASPTQTTLYLLTSGAGTCQYTDSVLITVNPLPDVSAGSDFTICKGDTIQINGIANGIYFWNTTFGLSDSTVYNPLSFPDTTCNYILTSILGNCAKNDTVKVSVYPLPEVMAGNDTIICLGEPLFLNASISNADIFSWSPPAGLNNSTILNPIFSGSFSSQYVLKAENSIAGCINSDTILISVEEVNASFSAKSIEGNVPLDVEFTNTSINAVSYVWEFGNGEKSTQISPRFTYEKVGEYLVYLIAISQNGCIDTSELLLIKPEDEIRITIPNVFTPNNDNINEAFIIFIDKIDLVKYIKGSIWNRWGAMIYEFNLPGGKWWDGTYEQKPCQTDAYVYIVEVADYKGKIYKFSGTVTLLR